MTAPTLLASGGTFVDVLRLRAEETPDALAYAFLTDDDCLQRLTYAELDRRSRAIAADLQERDLLRERALIVLPPGLDYVSAFFGCLYAGVVPVPAYPPRGDRGLERLHVVAGSAEPRVIFAAGPLADRLTRLGLGGGGSLLHVVRPSSAEKPLEEAWRAPAVNKQDLAFLQYSSGSTGVPKGVCVTHANLMHNSELIRLAFGHDAASRAVTWLPPYHDMGLVGGILQPVYVGFPNVLLSPVSSLHRPARWLRAVSAFRATTSGGPNFAYDLCVQRVTDAEKAELDLSTWSVAFSGAEPVRASTLRRFAAAFATCGFRAQAFQPCYGLAEATLIVSGGEKGSGVETVSVSRSALESHRARPARDDEPSEQVVACGRVLDGLDVAIVDAGKDVPLADGEIGEIWVRGPSVAAGYWRLPLESAATFAGHLQDGEGGPFLRTGDLGFRRDGKLFVTGRLKDLIIIRGRNLYPHDVEAAVERSHSLLRPGGGAAFAIDCEGEERLVVVHEVERRFQSGYGDEVRGAIRAAVSDVFDVSAWAVELIRPASLPRTSSGKVRRRACREAYLTGRLASWGGDTALMGAEEQQ